MMIHHAGVAVMRLYCTGRYPVWNSGQQL